MNLKKKLQNPFALVGQGFVAGAILFWTIAPAEADSPNPAPSAQAVAAQNIGA